MSTAMMTLEVLQDYMPNGYIDNEDDIFCKMFIRYNDDEQYIKDTVLGLYEKVIDETGSIPLFGDLVEECDFINEDCISQLAFNRAVDYLKDNAMEIEDISQRDFVLMIEQNEYDMMDQISYNNDFNVEQSIMKVAEEEGIAVTVSPNDNFYDDLTYGYSLNQGDDLEIMLNHAQQVMFMDLYEVDRVERVSDSSLFKYNDVYIEKETIYNE